MPSFLCFYCSVANIITSFTYGCNLYIAYRAYVNLNPGLDTRANIMSRHCRSPFLTADVDGRTMLPVCRGLYWHALKKDSEFPYNADAARFPVCTGLYSSTQIVVSTRCWSRRVAGWAAWVVVPFRMVSDLYHTTNIDAGARTAPPNDRCYRRSRLDRRLCDDTGISTFLGLWHYWGSLLLAAWNQIKRNFITRKKQIS